jgi:hypothetical protein
VIVGSKPEGDVRRFFVLAVAASLTLATFAAACGSGDDDGSGGSGDGTPQSTGTSNATASDATSVGVGTPSGTPAPGETTAPDGRPTLTPEEATAVADAGGITGGAEDAPPAVVVPPPAVSPPAGTQPVTDPATVADPAPPGGETRVIIDANASAPGIQSSREVNVGDVFRVGIVVANMPGHSNNQGMTALQFNVNYDKTKLFAASISGGPSVDRNPDLNQAALSGNWMCLPAPEGDIDDPGGINGDGNPATGQAFLPCFTGQGGAQGNFVFATLEFTAIASGTIDLELDLLIMGDSLAVPIGQCRYADDPAYGPEIPCDGATITVR